jgi:hypothetical protein
LIPTDFSPNAQKAADYAVRLFSDVSELVLVHTYQIPHSGANVLISVQDLLEKRLSIFCNLRKIESSICFQIPNRHYPLKRGLENLKKFFAE